MNISEISIKKPVFAWMLMAAMIVFGYLGFRKLGVGMLPDVDFPMVTVNLRYEGGAPRLASGS